jgi:hypothetical protein
LNAAQEKRISKEISLINLLVKTIINTEEVAMRDLQSVIPNVELQDKKMGEVTLFDCLFTCNFVLF